MPTAEDNANSDSDQTESLIDEAKNEINTIKNHAKWQLSLLAALALGLASFVFRDLGELPIIHEELDSAALFIKLFASFWLICYSFLITIFIPWLLWGAKVPKSSKNAAISKKQKAEKLKGRLEEYTKKLYFIDKRFKALIVLSIASPFLSAGIATYFTYLA